LKYTPTMLGVHKTPWPESASELYRPSERRLTAKSVPTSEDKGCSVVSVTDPYGLNLGFLDRSSYFFFQVAPQLYSRGWVDLVPDPLLLRKSARARNRTRTYGCADRKADHYATKAAFGGTQLKNNYIWGYTNRRLNATALHCSVKMVKQNISSRWG
jgi:hypothetical protein